MPGASSRVVMELRAARCWLGSGVLGLGLVFGAARPAGAAEPAPADVREGPVRTRASVPPPPPPVTPISGLLALSIGRGLRFNNPYRLARPLGSTAESVSLAATYLDIGGAVLFGAHEFRHGPALGGSVALQGIGQFVLTPSYLAQFGLGEGLAVHGRAGIPIVVAPDTTAGIEAGVGSRLAMAYGLGVQIELVGSAYFGAATAERSITTIPMLSLQLGIFFDHQVVP